MKSYHHPNVLSLYTSFVHGQELWMITPFMSGGSILHIMKYRFPMVGSKQTGRSSMTAVEQGQQPRETSNTAYSSCCKAEDSATD